MKMLVLQYKQTADGVVFIPAFVGKDDVTIYLPDWAKEIKIVRSESPLVKVHTIYVTDGEEWWNDGPNH